MHARSDRACPWLDRVGLGLLRSFARTWHGCVCPTTSPLPATGPAIVVANHPSHADPAFFLAGCDRPICFLQAREQYEVPGLRRLFAHFGCIPVARDGHDFVPVRRALRRLREGGVLGIFPAGEVSPPGRRLRRPGKRGAALLALRGGAPVYPAWIEGSPAGHGILGDWLWPSGGVRVIFGPEVDLSGYRGRPINRATLDEVTALLMHRIEALQPAGVSSPSGPLPEPSGAAGR